MDAAPPPRCGGDIVYADEILRRRAIKDDVHAAMDVPLLPYGDYPDADKTARSRTTYARVFLAIGLVLEVSATLWAFHQGVSAGALDPDVDCGSDGRLAKLFSSSRVVDRCGGQIDFDDLYSYPDATTERYSMYIVFLEYVGCDSLTDAPTAQHDFEKRCSCSSYYEGWGHQPCSWVAVSHLADGICYARGVFTDGDNGDVNGTVLDHGMSNCRPTNLSRTAYLATTSLVVALSSHLVQAFVGFKYWKDTEQRTAPTLAASIFVALGVLVVPSVLLTNPGLYRLSDYTTASLPGFVWLAWTIVTMVIIGTLAEITAGCSDSAAGRLPYLGAVGNGVIWLGAALLEIVVTLYLVWTGDRTTNHSQLLPGSVGLIALELLGLAAMWIARGLWTKARLLRSAKKLSGGL